MRYTVTVNTPGYLPDSIGDDWSTDDLTTARQALAAEIERDWDAESAYDLRADDRFLEAHTSANLIAPGESVYVAGIHANDLGRVYSLTVLEDGD